MQTLIARLINAIRTGLENADKNPQKAFGDSVRTTLYGNNPRKAQLTLADLKQANIRDDQTTLCTTLQQGWRLRLLLHRSHQRRFSPRLH